jgi:hypothetical protein
VQNPVIYNFDKSLLQGETRSSDRFVYSQYFLPLQVDPAQQSDTIRNLAQSQVGYLFLDRARIRPQGFAIGEHVYGMSLAPGEEVVVEQKTFSKRETTLEEQEEQERQFDLELSSTLSTELQEGLERQRSLTTSTGLTAGGSLGATIKGVEVNAELKYTKNVTEADTESRRRSVKDSTTASSKVASKYRALHKTVFRVATEERFETTNKRVIRNPNKFTPVDLHYFKLLQVLEMRQERYGSRLCWAPHVKDPAFDLFERIRLGKQEIMQKAEAVELPPKPVEPIKPTKPPVWATSGEFRTDKWGFACDMRYDYTLEIPVQAGYVWDGDAQSIKNSVSLRPVNINRGYHYYVVGEPWASADKVYVKVHVGVDGKTPGGCGEIYIRAGARCLPAPDAQDAQYAAAYQAWLTAMAEWNKKVDEIKAKSRSEAQEQAEAWEQDMLARVNPVAELINRVIKQNFPETVRDEGWEVEVWRQLFDWESAAYFLHPSWWSSLPMRDHTRAPTDFFNASWARLYLPVKLGFEQLALRWIFGQTTETPLSAELEATFAKLQKELNDYRRLNFGDERETVIQPDGTSPKFEEKSLYLGQWTELMPTDGTHVEVVQAMTSAADTLTQGEIDDAHNLRTRRITGEERDNALKQKAFTDMKKPVDAQVRINAGDPWPDSSDSLGR